MLTPANPEQAIVLESIHNGTRTLLRALPWTVDFSQAHWAYSIIIIIIIIICG